MDCREIDFSPEHSKKRIEKAESAFDVKALFKILAFSLHLLGAKRRNIATLTGMPEESVKTAVRVILRDGFEAFSDRRKSKTADSMPAGISEGSKDRCAGVKADGDYIVVGFGSADLIRIPSANKIQVRTVLLSLVNSGMLSVSETASMLGISDAHCRRLAEKLECSDVEEALTDRRKGQTHDFRFGPAQKAEIIRQFSARTLTGHSTSSEVLTELINGNTNSSLSPRTVRLHMKKLGLMQIKTSLPELADALKKNS